MHAFDGPVRDRDMDRDRGQKITFINLASEREQKAGGSRQRCQGPLWTRGWAWSTLNRTLELIYLIARCIWGPHALLTFKFHLSTSTSQQPSRRLPHGWLSTSSHQHRDQHQHRHDHHELHLSAFVFMPCAFHATRFSTPLAAQVGGGCSGGRQKMLHT